MWGQWISRLNQVMAGVRGQLIAASSAEQASHREQYHLGRGRRAREAGRPDLAVQEARRAVALNPRNPWAHALLGQCLLHTDTVHWDDAVRTLAKARTLDPANGYFVRLSLEALDARGDTRGRSELLQRAWWAGAPVERWLPDGPQPQARPTLAPADRHEPAVPHSTPNRTIPVSANTRRQPVSA